MNECSQIACTAIEQVSRGHKCSVPSLTDVHPLHLLGSFKFDPPGSTHFQCCLSSKSSIGGMERGPLPVKQVCASSNRPGKVCARLEMVGEQFV